MKIAFENTIDDFIAFNNFHYEHSPSMWRLRVLFTWGPVALILSLGAYTAWSEQTWDALIFAVIAAGVLGWFLTRLFRPSLDKMVRQLVAEGSNKGLLGPRELELEGNWLHERSEFQSHSVSLQIIDKIESSDEHTFIYNSAVSAIALPRRCASEGEYQSFVGALIRTWRAAKAGQDQPHDI
jgi:hypothetical protein